MNASKKTPLFYPFVFGLLPVLLIVAEQGDEIRSREIIMVLLVGVAIVWGLFRLTVGVIGDRHRAGFACACLVGMLFSYRTLLVAAKAAHPVLGPWVYYTVALAFVGLMVAYAVWSRSSPSDLTRLSNWIAAGLLTFVVFRCGATVLASIGACEPPMGTLLTPAVATQEFSHELPDIYYLVLDRYGNQETLRSAYGFDNQTFVDYLEAKGFHVERDAHCNYARSNFSLWSTLNMQYHPDILDRPRTNGSLRSGHHVGEFLRLRGYRYFHLGSWYWPTSHCRQADLNVQAPVHMSEFGLVIAQMTPLLHCHWVWDLWDGQHAANAQFQLRKIREVASQPGPKFVFAHILLPHPPFVFDSRGNRIQRIEDDYAAASKRCYVEQLEYTNRQIEILVDVLLSDVESQPVIILQGDEGPWLRRDDRVLPSVDQLRIRTGVLNACFLPGHGEAIPTPMTPVNTFRLVLNRYFGTELPWLENRLFAFDGIMQPSRQDPDTCQSRDITSQVMGDKPEFLAR